MPKATVTIDLPEGWELAESKMRSPNVGEFIWSPGCSPIPAKSRHCLNGFEYFIVRRIATEYVNVKLRREDAEWVKTQCEPLRGELPATQRPVRVIEAITEALRERCGNGCVLKPGHLGIHTDDERLLGLGV